ncbi:MAG TPA: amidohydrolase family protein [Xanthobacteraceae bacterium]|jgi:predicted TIM-barrel fold metal-dependent hydrolase|nr:amidohydrolase family protein [Xanthobacteraceae bacterium]
MKVLPGAIDCDIHPTIPETAALLPYLSEYWRDQFIIRHIDRYPFTLASYPPNSPLSCRPDWRPETGLPGSDFDGLRRQALDAFGVKYSICNVLHGSIALFNEDMGAALCAAVNDWTIDNLLDKDSRLRGSILLPTQNPDLAVKEIERLASDHRFVQVTMLAMGDALAGGRRYWPIYKAAEKHQLTVGIHAGSTFRHAPTYSGWPSYHVEDYIANGPAFENVLVSLIAEGVFQEFPGLKVVCAESGVTWLPTLLWRTNKEWRGVRAEVPWIERAPADIIRDHVRFTIQPFDLPAGDAVKLQRILEHIGSDSVLLYASDYPHWHFDGEESLPDGLPDRLMQKLLNDNALETYPRLSQQGNIPAKRLNGENLQ